MVKGQAQINQTGTAGATSTTIKQSTPQVSINWQSFNVGDKERVNFVQPDASSLAINRILGTEGSIVQGNIRANGQVWLINPNGIVFGKNAQVNVGGLVATTLDTANPGSLTGAQRFNGNSTAAVTNSGLLSASEGGYVALLGHRVSNQGEINAPAGTVALGAGSAVDLQFNNNQLLGVQVYESLLDAMSENGGVVRADAAAAIESFLAEASQGQHQPADVNKEAKVQPESAALIDPKVMMYVLSETVPDDALVVEEAPTSAAFLHQFLKVRRPLQAFGLSSGGLGFGLPGAIGMALANPGRRVVALIGDGSAMYAIQGLWTAAHLRLAV
ncbi:MAG: filamentous hemagglutinin N-terminal domain-containing protein, partial [Chitinophagia bacterium]|nr:filamentous hemagglutinin N-terminal domain-containing protein [Chitinophagia bacterium]